MFLCSLLTKNSASSSGNLNTRRRMILRSHEYLIFTVRSVFEYTEIISCARKNVYGILQSANVSFIWKYQGVGYKPSLGLSCRLRSGIHKEIY
jgi:hypothetical protein